MELPVWHISMIILLIIVLFVVIIIIVNPSLIGLNHTRGEIETINGCREWNSTGCSEASVSSYKDKIRCKKYEECLIICRNLGSCW
ncbi:MAG: hypothetical protein QXL09_01705 [Candidatus Aenigmatarchaeota archaeon]